MLTYIDVFWNSVFDRTKRFIPTYSTKLGKRHPWIKVTQMCTNKEQLFSIKSGKGIFEHVFIIPSLLIRLCIARKCFSDEQFDSWTSWWLYKYRQVLLDYMYYKAFNWVKYFDILISTSFRSFSIMAIWTF